MRQRRPLLRARNRAGGARTASGDGSWEILPLIDMVPSPEERA